MQEVTPPNYLCSGLHYPKTGEIAQTSVLLFVVYGGRFSQFCIKKMILGEVILIVSYSITLTLFGNGYGLHASH